jgi:hypothetical protein
VSALADEVGGNVDDIDVSLGRRIYIHQTTFRSLALQRRDIAEWVTRVLGSIRAARVVHHHLVDQAMNYGLMEESVSKRAVRPFENFWKQDLTALLRAVGHRPSVPRNRSLFEPVLTGTEQVVASCFDEGYYTFATTSAAADRMFSDSAPMSELVRDLSAGSGPTDLVIIRGRCLAVIDSKIGVGKVGKDYALQLSRHLVKNRELTEIDETIRSEIVKWADAHLAPIKGQVTDPTERKLLDECIRSVAAALVIRNSL